MMKKPLFIHSIIAVVLLANLGLIVLSLWSALFGPRDGLILGIVGFIVGFIWFAIKSSSKRVKEHLALLPMGLSGSIKALETIHPIIKKLILGNIILIFLCLLLLFTTARSAGVADFPAFERLPVYELNSHGMKTAVSRLRYITVSVSQAVGWHSFAALLSLFGLYRISSGEDFDEHFSQTRSTR